MKNLFKNVFNKFPILLNIPSDIVSTGFFIILALLALFSLFSAWQILVIIIAFVLQGRITTYIEKIKREIAKGISEAKEEVKK